MISLAGLAAQFTELMLAVVLAPMLTGWVNQCRTFELTLDDGTYRTANFHFRK